MSATAPNPDGGMLDRPELEVYGSDSPDIEALLAIFFDIAGTRLKGDGTDLFADGNCSGPG